MARLLERAGTSSLGSITGIYSVLVDGDDLNDPIADSARSVLDGHIVLSRSQAQRGLYPAVSVLESISRLETAILDDAKQALAHEARRLYAELDQVRDLIDLGAYVMGSNPNVDRALEVVPQLTQLFSQGMMDLTPAETTWDRLAHSLGMAR
jgi:flagellum-specific ATP synthase